MPHITVAMEPSAATTARLLQDYSWYDAALYTNAQEWTLVLIPYFSAPLSVVGSGLILYVIWNERQTKLQESYHRLMMGLSMMNFFNSLSMIVLGNWSVPEEVDFPLASGNETTCSIAGFFLHLVFGSMWYSFFLALNFALRIRCERQPKCVARYCEPFAHVLGCLYPIVAATIAAARDYFNPVEPLVGWCWSTDFPNACGDKGDAGCIRGNSHNPAADAATIIILFVGIAICMVLITLKVRRTELNMRRYSGSTARAMIRTRQSRIQALLYMGAFGAVYFPMLGLMALGDDFTQHSQGLYFAFAVLTKLFMPLQGFFNAFIYFRNNFRALQQEGRSLSFIPKWGDKISTTLRMRTTAMTRNSTGSTSGTNSGDATPCRRSSADNPTTACEKVNDGAESPSSNLDGSGNECDASNKEKDLNGTAKHRPTVTFADNIIQDPVKEDLMEDSTSDGTEDRTEESKEEDNNVTEV